MKDEIRTKKGYKTRKKLAKKRAFAIFVKKLSYNKDERSWSCCHSNYSDLVELHKHVAMSHEMEINEKSETLLKSQKTETAFVESPQGDSDNSTQSVARDSATSLSSWLPSDEECATLGTSDQEEGQILLFYHYTTIPDPAFIRHWQQLLCDKLNITGKTSAGGRHHFSSGLHVSVHEEIVPMGIDPDQISYHQAGSHLTVEEFHDAVQNHDDNTVLIDCRNFYESKIGKFTNALTPNIRKFSYWPEYVDRNLHVFNNKKVLMYCTGGIRCERGSAYLESKGVCKEVCQLQGGIHRYIEKYPDGNFRGKLFVFDDRCAIPANSDIISKCSYCSRPWDDYKSCTSDNCYQLVLSCTQCRETGMTACCTQCSDKQKKTTDQEMKTREECACTKTREKIPVEKMET
uniref:Thiosulfate sulfurtransferase/rhodanese-like domain-containing protein 2-like n=1 Tax=Saccoglossus kowalevskii TaxID=10224 RepID=A0ABM0GZJ9_SACKO|nr:PREDICTED: thiosulfate sulfurtransferase/rhodanese-like domain-containing protein 2-like [Saccoglossus kowalevskii]